MFMSQPIDGTCIYTYVHVYITQVVCVCVCVCVCVHMRVCTFELVQCTMYNYMCIHVHVHMFHVLFWHPRFDDINLCAILGMTYRATQVTVWQFVSSVRLREPKEVQNSLKESSPVIRTVTILNSCHETIQISKHWNALVSKRVSVTLEGQSPEQYCKFLNFSVLLFQRFMHYQQFYFSITNNFILALFMHYQQLNPFI